MLKGIIRKVGQELDEWQRAVDEVMREVEGGRGVHQVQSAGHSRSWPKIESKDPQRETKNPRKEGEPL